MSWWALAVVGAGIVVASWAALALLAVLARRLPPGVLRELAGFLPNCVALARRLRREPAVPRRAKLALAVAGLWVLSPIDLIPEFLPVIGPLDDVVVIALALRAAARRVPRTMLVAAWDGDPRVLDRLLGADGRGDSGRARAAAGNPARPAGRAASGNPARPADPGRATLSAMADAPGGDQFHFDPVTYLDMVRGEVPAYDELQDTVAAAAAGRRAERVLDLGVGTGQTARRVLDRHPGAVLVGIDESAGMLAAAGEHLAGTEPPADLRVGRLEDPLPAGPFDLVVSALAVHHLDRAGKADLFARVAERLGPGGRFVLGDVVVPDDPADVVTPVDGVYDQPSSVVDQLRWLADAGFDARVVWTHRDLAVLVADRP